MLRRTSCVLWILQACLLFYLFDSSVPQTASNGTEPTAAAPNPTEEEDAKEKVDSTVIYIIVVIVFVFIVTIISVVLATVYQARHHPPSRRTHPPLRRPDQSTSTNNPKTGVAQPPRELNRAYERNSIVGISPEGETEWWEIPQDKLTIYKDKVLGSGQFGVIWLGDVVKDRTVTKCAVKSLKADSSENDRKNLKEELRKMSNMDPHQNIVNLIGGQTKGDVLYVVVEYCANGDLYNYVKKRRTDHSWLGQKESGTSIEYVTRLRIAFDVANGMNYLSTKQFIHRDLAARNVLLDGNVRGKVSDFGRARDVRETFKTVHSVRRNEPIPTRWMPVETLRSQIFTPQSDVWSYGVLLWEIESGALRPYNEQQTYREVVNKVVHEGYRLQQPSYCPDVVYQIMTECWKIDPEERPTFGEIANNLSKLLQAHLPGPPKYSTLAPQ